MNWPKLSLVTGLRNRPESCVRLVDSVIRNTPPISWEMIIADASDVPITDVYKFPENIIVLPERPRLGYSAGYNRALSKATGEWVIILNDDAETLPSYASHAIRFMESNPRFGIGALRYADDMTRETFHVNTCGYGMLYSNFPVIRRALGEAITPGIPAL